MHAFTALCVGTAAAWGASRLQYGPFVSVTCGAGAAVIAAMLSRMLGEPPSSRRLEWNGERWLLREANGSFAPGSVDIALDLDHWLLLRFRADRSDRIAAARVRWLPLRAADLPDTGSALRAALIDAAAARPVAR